ncbi:hypothetical protein [Georgenia sp. AZ-5]|uniref:hypothetical protein n=1 Tax=Georgenia sp. AZ-5 TaxID=3367526 RepID=UPI003755014B
MRQLAALTLAGALLALASSAAASTGVAPPAASTGVAPPAATTGVAPPAGTPAEGVPTGACAPGEGVTVVVDSSDLGGELRVGCAPGDPATGRDALEAAGFTPTDSAPGLICAIDALPDPCPAEFDGNYWAYWSAGTSGEWTMRSEGADTADPAPGEVEGWRYNDGGTPPSVAPAELGQAAPATGAPGPDVAGGQADDAADDAAAGTPVALVVGVAAIAALVLAGVLLARRRG